MGLRAWWRRRAGGGNETADRTGSVAGWDAAADTAAFAAARGADEATVMVGSVRGAEPAPGAETEALPTRAAALGRAPEPSPGLAPTRAVTAPHAARPRVVGVLVVVEGEFEGRAFALFEGANRIGREHVCEICLPSERLAPQHACIDCRADAFRIERIAGPELRVNFEPFAGGLLRDGDAIQLGMTTFRFRSIVGG